MLLMTFLFFVVEIGFGYLSNSMALVADSFHMLSDVLALAIAYGCLKVSIKAELGIANRFCIYIYKILKLKHLDVC